ncbi:MAG TPA: DUF3224 domain-containing protein [Blastocatellia bacterium]|nr:DUF3224 domain-containing protein [Blastocatellia bacterium]
MEKIYKTSAIVVVTVLFICGISSLAYTRSSSTTTNTGLNGAIMSTHATGPFDVKLTPQDEKSIDANFGRFIIDKQYHGDIEGTGKGQMLSAGSAQSSGAYVAIEFVTCTLQGRKGTFALMHKGVMTRGVPDLDVSVVPDSGTGQLVGITGKMNIKIDNGKHSYEFDYTLPEAH